MTQIEITTTLQSDVVESNAPGSAADEAQPTAAGQGTTLPPAEPPLTATPSTDEPFEKEDKPAISGRKLAANRVNAQRSTGPKTQQGKEKSKFNAVKHGLTARYFPAVIQVGTAEGEQFEAVRADLYDHYQPVGPIEELVLEKIITEYMRYRRLVEREQLCAHNRGYYLETVDRLTRYQTAINRQLFEAIRELERLQAQRKAKEKDRESDGSSD
jgi:hypothetical protein